MCVCVCVCVCVCACVLHTEEVKYECVTEEAQILVGINIFVGKLGSYKCNQIVRQIESGSRRWNHGYCVPREVPPVGIHTAMVIRSGSNPC